MVGNWRRLSDGGHLPYTLLTRPMYSIRSGRSIFGSLVFPGLKEYIFTSLKKMKTSHLYNAAGAHYNTIEPCQSNFVRVNRPGDSMPLSCQNAKNSEKLESLQHLNDGYEAILCNDWDGKHVLRILLSPLRTPQVYKLPVYCHTMLASGQSIFELV